MLSQPFFSIFSFVLLSITTAHANGIYTKNSPVLQIENAKSYDKLIARSNQVSILEFYAPWCGHCQNLKPAYEKAAKGLDGLAQVAAIDCDDEPNKPFCGSMGVQGFPTLKIIKPGKKRGKPSVEDYQGPRTAKGIVEAVKSAIPNHVKRISDKGLEKWLKDSNETSKVILFSDKGTTSALIKVLAADFVDSIKFAQIRDKETTANQMFDITDYPTLVMLPGGDASPIVYDGKFSKSGMTKFLKPYAASSTEEEAPKAPPKAGNQAPLKEEQNGDEAQKSASDSAAFAQASSSHASEDASEGAAGATTITVKNAEPTESPDPIATPEGAPAPAAMPDLAPPIASLESQEALQQSCLGMKSSTCVLVLMPALADSDTLPESATTAQATMAEIAHKYRQGGRKLFPFYTLPAANPGAESLRTGLEIGGDGAKILAINSKRGWWRAYDSTDHGLQPIEDWIDEIRLGEGQKNKLPQGLVEVEQENTMEDHDEL